MDGQTERQTDRPTDTRTDRQTEHDNTKHEQHEHVPAVAFRRADDVECFNTKHETETKTESETGTSRDGDRVY